jgi:leucyl-tRNA synthetase
VEGSYRFLCRIWTFVFKNNEILRSRDVPDLKGVEGLSEVASNLLRKTHQTIKKVTSSIERDYHFNTAIAALMELMNEVSAFKQSGSEDKAVLQFSMKNMMLLISPFAPHFAEELWRELGGEQDLFNRKWPVWDDEIAKEEGIELVVQINGKVRAKIMATAGLDDEIIKEKAFADVKIQEYIKDKTLRKVIVVKSRLVNIVI